MRFLVDYNAPGWRFPSVVRFARERNTDDTIPVSNSFNLIAESHVLFGRKKKDKQKDEARSQSAKESAPDAGQSGLPQPPSAADQTAQAKPEKKSGGLFARLAKTREALTSGVVGLFGGGRKVDAALFDALEDELLMADVGVDATTHLVDALRAGARKESIEDASGLLGLLRREMIAILNDTTNKMKEPGPGEPRVTLMVGVNGVGKTTTTAKLAARAKAEGQDVMLAAADTFRAAAIEQLQEWGERLDIPVVAQSHGSDAAAVAFDALSSARARSTDQLIIDTAGRQHTHDDLMEQLGKIERVLKRNDADAPHETLITLDAANGQNVLVQIEQFSAQTPITGVVVSKLDGTAKGGVVFAIARKFGLPIRYIGVGEGVEDLRPFDVEAFVDALLPAADDLGGGNSG